MDKLEIAGTKLLAQDGRARIVELDTNNGAYGTEIWAHTQSDVKPIFGKMSVPFFPGNVAVHTRKIKKSVLKDLRKDPRKFTKGPNGALLARVRRLKPSALRVSVMMDDEIAYDVDLDPLYVRASTGIRAHIVGLPPHESDTPDSLMRRLRNADDVNGTLPEAVRKMIVPQVWIDGPNAIPILRRLVDAGADIIILEFHGCLSAQANLATLKGILSKAKKPPYIIANNVPRLGPNDASGLLWAVAQGVQVCAMESRRWFPSDEDPAKQLAKLKWFQRSRGGYVEASKIPKPWDASCTCPDAPAHFAADDTEAAVPARKRHEIWAHIAEAAPFTAAVATGTLSEYVAARPLLNGGLGGGWT